MTTMMAEDAEQLHPPPMKAQTVISDGDFITGILSNDIAMRMAFLRQMVLRHYAEMSGLIEAAFFDETDADARTVRAYMIARLANSRDVALDVLVDEPPSRATLTIGKMDGTR